MMWTRWMLALCVFFGCMQPGFAHTEVNPTAVGTPMTTIYFKGSRPDDHAPIGVMGDHTHRKGDVMFSYRYMWMHMDGNRDGTNGVSDAQVLRGFMVAPTQMNTHMHMFGGMVGVTDRITVMAMLPYIQRTMDHVTRAGTRFTTRANGIGDLQVSSLVTLKQWEHHRLQLNTGLSVPTGSINQRDATPAGLNTKLPYPMQLGSGTIDAIPGVTYSGQSNHWSWGAQALTRLPIGENKNDYRLGERVWLTPWLSRQWSQWLSTSVRVEGQWWGNIHGSDPELVVGMVPTANPNLRAGQRVDVAFGLNMVVPKGLLKDNRLAVEFALPVYQDLDGPQLETDFRLTVGWQWLLPW